MTIDSTPAVTGTGRIRLDVSGAVRTLTIDRPEALGALSESMYDQLDDAVRTLHGLSEPGVLVVRGSGGRAFAAGTDIAYMRSLGAPGAGVRYERRVRSVLHLLERLPMPTIAAIDGICMGAGLLIAAACDVRIATEKSRFGVPIAKTLGNCLSADSLSLLSDKVGSSIASAMIVRARIYDAHELVHNSFLQSVTDAETFEGELASLIDEVADKAPLTITAVKSLLAELRSSAADVVDDADIIERVYTSADFESGAAAFLDHVKPHWTGR